MIHVEGNLNVDKYLDQSITIGRQDNVQNNTQFNTENQIKDNLCAPDGQEFVRKKSKPIYFSEKRGQRVNLYRVIIALLESGFFSDGNGGKPTQKDVFEAFGEMLNNDFSGFHKDLSEANKRKDEQIDKLFDSLKNVMKEYVDEKY